MLTKGIAGMLFALSFMAPMQGLAQIRLNNPGTVVERQAEMRANRKVDQAVDRGFDAAEKGIGNIFRKKEKDTKTGKGAQTPASQSSENTPVPSGETKEIAAAPAEKATLKSYSKFDFIPGEKVVAVEDFSQDAVGDFPARWNTNSSGEVVTIEGIEGKWLLLGPEGVFYPEFISKLPENFTLEFDAASSSKFSFYSGFLRVVFAAVNDPAKDFTKWQWYDGGKEKGIEVGIHPTSAGGAQGMSFFNVFADRTSIMKNEKDFPAFHAPDRNVVRVSVWRQKTRLRLYVDDMKVWDLPRAFDATANYNMIAFSNHGYHDPNDRYYVRNLRLAVGAPDTRNKLITEGKFSTTGILFNVSSAQIRPESYGVLKDIAAVLTENAAVKVRIVGYTDSDGDDAANLALSKKRSEAVKAALGQDFGIDPTRLETDGKGESEPAAPNTTVEGKANNRRVEFVKL